MRLTHKLLAEECEHSGELGLVLDGMITSNMQDNGDPYVMHEPNGIAHDLIEHVNGIESIGTVEDECQALGAIWYTRGQFDDMRRDSLGRAHTPYQHIAADLTRMLPLWLSEGSEAPPTRVGDCPYIDDLREAIEKARHDILEEYDGDLIDGMSSYLTDALAWMVRGIRKQRARFPDPMAANRLFWDIEEALKGIFRDLYYDGQAWEITIDGPDVSICELVECSECYAMVRDLRGDTCEDCAEYNESY